MKLVNGIMKYLLLSLLILFVSKPARSQYLLDFISYPVSDTTSIKIKTQDLLDAIQWDSLVGVNKFNSRELANFTTEKGLKIYEYSYGGRRSWFHIKSFDGCVIEMSGEIATTGNQVHIEYFDHANYTDYIRQHLDLEEDEYVLEDDYDKEIVKGYYELLDTTDNIEYGWFCEYSTVGMITKKRKAVIQLLNYPYLLEELFEIQEPTVKLYIADAILYLHYIRGLSVEEQKEYYPKVFVDETFPSAKLLEKVEEWISEGNAVTTCGNSGSYKQYRSTTDGELPRDKRRVLLLEGYRDMQRMGYVAPL